jgi:HAD superfamily hydrolase (TIGR01549 family)
MKKTYALFLFCLPLLGSFGLAQDNRRTIAVLDFNNNSIVDKEKLEPLKKGLADILITELRIGLVSSGSKQRVLKDLARNRLENVFEIVVTGDDADFPKPHPDGLLRAMKHMRLEPQNTLYVGDAEEDFEMSRGAGVQFIGVESAFSGLRSESYIIVNGVAKLPALLTGK